MLSMKALEPVRLELAEKEVQQLVFVFSFFFFVPPWLLMDGGLSGSGWLSLVST